MRVVPECRVISPSRAGFMQSCIAGRFFTDCIRDYEVSRWHTYTTKKNLYRARTGLVTQDQFCAILLQVGMFLGFEEKLDQATANVESYCKITAIGKDYNKGRTVITACTNIDCKLIS